MCFHASVEASGERSEGCRARVAQGDCLLVCYRPLAHWFQTQNEHKRAAISARLWFKSTHCNLTVDVCK
jgi:hypothetical protein